jgi:hypothetical protein
MKTSWNCGETGRDDFAGRLTDVALAVTARHDVGGGSVDRELALWHSFGTVVRDTGCAPDREDLLIARLTDVAYQMALAHGSAGAFIDLELDLWHSLRWTLSGRGRLANL